MTSVPEGAQHEGGLKTHESKRTSAIADSITKQKNVDCIAKKEKPTQPAMPSTKGSTNVTADAPGGGQAQQSSIEQRTKKVPSAKDGLRKHEKSTPSAQRESGLHKHFERHPVAPSTEDGPHKHEKAHPKVPSAKADSRHMEANASAKGGGLY